MSEQMNCLDCADMWNQSIDLGYMFNVVYFATAGVAVVSFKVVACIVFRFMEF